MWRATVLAAGLAAALGTLGAVDAAAQGKGNGKASAKATERFEERDSRAASTRGSGTTARGATRESDEPWYRRGSTTDGRRDGAVYDRRDGDIYERRGSVYDTDDRYGQGQGPAFCRSGAGHPTKGRQWCYDKGYGLGNERWSRVGGWDDVIFGRSDRRYDGSMSGSVLQDILGRTIYGRLVSQSRSYGWGSLSGRWLDAAAGPRILQIQAGSRPLAEFYDQNRDGRVDLVMMARAR